MGAAGRPLTVVTLPGAHPVFPCACVQWVTEGSERLTTMFVYLPAGTAVEIARRLVSLWSLVRSTWYESEFRGTFTDPPASGVNETPATVVRKESRLLLAVDGKGAARRVRIRAPLLAWPEPEPDPDPTTILGWLQDSRERATIKAEREQKFLTARPLSLGRMDLRSGLKLAFPWLTGSVAAASCSNHWQNCQSKPNRGLGLRKHL